MQGRRVHIREPHISLICFECGMWTPI